MDAAMTKPEPQQRGGVAGLAFFFAIVALGAGLAFDFALSSGSERWLLSAPGGRALLGAGATLLLIGLAHALRRVLGRAVGRADASHQS